MMIDGLRKVVLFSGSELDCEIRYYPCLEKGDAVSRLFLFMFSRMYKEFESMDGHKIAIVVFFNACFVFFFCCVGFLELRKKVVWFFLSILLTFPVRATGQREACFVQIEINKYIRLKIVHFHFVVMRFCIALTIVYFEVRSSFFFICIFFFE